MSCSAFLVVLWACDREVGGWREVDGSGIADKLWVGKGPSMKKACDRGLGGGEGGGRITCAVVVVFGCL